VHALPVAHALKNNFPAARITWVVEKPAYDLVANNPCIDEVIIFNKPGFKSWAGLWQNAPGFIRQLRSHHFDVTLDLQAIFKGAAIAFFSGAPRRLVYCNTREMADLFSKRVCGPNQNGHVVERYLDVVRALGCKVDEVVFPLAISAAEAESAAAVAKWAGLDVTRPYIVLSPGANWPNKRWPARLFSQLADRLHEAGRIPVLTGGPGDRALAEEIAAGSTIPLVDITGKTSLKQLAYIIKQAKVLVGGDTGPMHLAAALATPVVALHGPTDIIRNGPYGQGHRALVTPRDCAGCWRRACPKGLDCLAEITVDAVHAAVNEVLHGN
jgi:heptosyltransferase I